MKNLIILAVLLIATSAAAIDYDFVYNSIVRYKCTKKISVPVSPQTPIMYASNTTGSVFINATSLNTGFPFVAGTAYRAKTSSSTSALAFNCTSSNTGYVHIIK